MIDRSPKSKLMGRCFVLTCGSEYIGCVSVQQDEFYSTACATHYDAMLEARKMAVKLREEHVIAECVCHCLH